MEFIVKELSNESNMINDVKDFLYNQIKKEYGIGPNIKFHYDIEDLEKYYINPDCNIVLNIFILKI